MTQTSKLYDYQKELLADNSNLRAVLKARQIGMSFTIALESFLHAQERKCNTIFVSASEKLAIELMRKVKKHKEFFEIITEQKIPLLKESSTEVEFASTGSRIISLSTNIATARSYTVDYLYLDEFVFIPHVGEVYQAITPSTSRGGQITLLSTPGPATGMFYDIFNPEEDPILEEKYKTWNKHTIDVYKAVEGGYPVSIDTLREKIPDPDQFAVEYECKFHNKLLNFISRDLLIQNKLDKRPGKVDNYFIGIDIGRKKDTTEIMILGEKAGTYFLIDSLQLEDTPYTVQKRTIESYIDKYKPRKVRIDSTGIGNQLAEELEKDYPSICEGIWFTNKNKDYMANYLKGKLTDKKLKLPKDNKLYSHIMSIQKELTNAGNYTYKVNSTEHHGDKFWALALGLTARETVEVLSEPNNLIY